MSKFGNISSIWTTTRIQYKITVYIFVILLVIGIAGAATMLVAYRANTLKQFEESAMIVAAALQGSLEKDFLTENMNHLQEELESITEQDLINEVVIFSPELVVIASGRLDEVGTIRQDSQTEQVLSTGITATRMEVMYEESEFCVITPIYNTVECQECHNPAQKILGAIEIGIDRSAIENQVREQTLIMFIIGGLTFISVGAALAFTLKSAVVNPLSKLSESARRISKGDFSARIDNDRKDEVGAVADTFNEMAEKVEQHALALQEAKDVLEQRVDERTHEVQNLAATRGQLLKRLISAQEEERQRVARELHDEIGQALSAIMLDLATAIQSLPEDQTVAREKLSQSRLTASQTMTDLRKMIYDLRPEVLDQLGLVPALRSYVKTRLESTNTSVQIDFSGLNGRNSPQLEITLFRVIQEAVTNIVRHAEASKVSIHVTQNDSKINVTIEDNGKGFDVEAAFNAQESWGLRGIRERVAVVGGELDVESKRDVGTTMKIEIPLIGVNI